MTELVLPENPRLFLRKAMQSNFIAFLMRAWPEVTGGEEISWNWHLDAIAYQLDRVARGDCRRLVLNLPPRNGKSKLVSIAWVAFMLGQDPTLNFVCVSYSNELSSKLARDCLSIMQSDWYRDLFPATRISRKRSANWDFETTRGGGRLATSVAGTLTGRGGDIIILDDVIKPEEANSETARENVNNWFQSTLSSRLNDKSSGSILCVMQRLHQLDLPGLLLETGKYDQLSLPAIAQDAETIPLTRGRFHHRKPGQVLHPAREPLEVLEEMRASMGSAAFNAQYQQDPVPAHGNVFRIEWLTTADTTEGPEGYGEIVQSWDTAIKTGQLNDWSVCITAKVKDTDVYVLDVWRGRAEFPHLKRMAVELGRRFQPEVILIEDKASGQQLLQELRADPSMVTRPTGRNPEGDKLTRATGVSPMVEAGQLHLPKESPWLADFLSELLSFPNGRHDDQVDALSQLLAWVRQRVQWQEPLGSPPEVPAPYGAEDDYGDPTENPYLIDLDLDVGPYEGDVWS